MANVSLLTMEAKSVTAKHSLCKLQPEKLSTYGEEIVL
jgi:hypothetical protein